MPDVTCRRARGERKDRSTRPRVGERRPSNRATTESARRPFCSTACEARSARRWSCASRAMRVVSRARARMRAAQTRSGAGAGAPRAPTRQPARSRKPLAPRAAEPHPGAYELTRRPCGNERVVSLEVHSFGGGSTRTWPALSAEASSKPPRLRERVLRLSGHRVMVLDHADTSWPSGAAQRGRGEPKSSTTGSDCAALCTFP